MKSKKSFDVSFQQKHKECDIHFQIKLAKATTS